MFKLLRTFVVGIPLVLAPAALGSAVAMAQDIEFIGTNRDWHAFQFMEGGNRVCFMATKPTREEGNYTSRGDVFLLVTHRPAENTRDVVSIMTGYTYQANSEATVQIGSQSFRLFTSDETAWARDGATDQALVAAMRAGTNMTVRGTSSRGTLTTDTYSLLGFTASYNAITQACGL